MVVDEVYEFGSHGGGFRTLKRMISGKKTSKICMEHKINCLNEEEEVKIIIRLIMTNRKNFQVKMNFHCCSWNHVRASFCVECIRFGSGQQRVELYIIWQPYIGSEHSLVEKHTELVRFRVYKQT